MTNFRSFFQQQNNPLAIAFLTRDFRPFTLPPAASARLCPGEKKLSAITDTLSMVGNLPLSSTVFQAPSTTRHLARTVSRSNRGHCGSSSASTDSCRRLAWISSSVARWHSCSSVGVASERVEQSTVMAPYVLLREFWSTRSRSLLMRQRIRLWIMLKMIWFQRWQTEVAWMSVEIGSCLNIAIRS